MAEDITFNREQEMIIENVICFASDPCNYEDRKRYITMMFKAFKSKCIEEENSKKTVK